MRELLARSRALRGVGTPVVPPIPPNVAMRYGLADARGYDYPIEQR